MQINFKKFNETLIKNVIIASILSLVGAFGTVHAKPITTYETMYDSCVKKLIKEFDLPNINNGVAEACLTSVNNTARDDMAGYYQAIHLKFRKQSKKRANQFEKEQKSWLVFRDEQCHSNGVSLGLIQCHMEMNAARANELKSLAKKQIRK